MDLRIECQDLEKVFVIDRIAKFHTQELADGAETSLSSDAIASSQKFFPKRHVTALPMPRNLPDRIELPPLTDIVKGGKLKELAPYNPDWYYIRAASMARKIYLRGGLGVGVFRIIYGGAKRNGNCPLHFCKSSGSVASHILQQLQNVNIIDLNTKGGWNGQRDLDQVAGRIAVAP